MRNKVLGGAAALAVAGAALVGFAPTSPATQSQAQGFHISDGRLVDANGQDFVMRGVNHAHTWYPEETTQSLADIKATGANTVRVVLSTGDQWEKTEEADVAGIVDECKQNKLICVFEAHDTTGYGEAGAAVSLDRAADYWLDVQGALTGQESYTIVNLGNEPFGNSGYEAWADDTSAAIQKLRDGGFEHTLMADAPNWGQDWSGTMRDNAESVFAADPQQNTLFDIHMYGQYESAEPVESYLNHFKEAGLPIVVGEFGNQHSDGDPDEDAIMSAAQAQGVGYLGWSWSGNGSGVEYLDMVTGFDAAQLTEWGDRIVNGADGIKETSKEASVYGG